MTLDGTGTMPGTGEIALGNATITKLGPGLLELTADYSAVGLTTQRIELLQGGTLVASIPGHTGPVARFAAWPTGCGKERIWDGSGTSCYGWEWDRPIPMQVLGTGGGSWQADEIRVLAEGPGSLSEIRSLSLTGRDLGSITVLAASEKSGATATAYGNSCGGLTANSSLPTIGSTAPVALAGIAPSTLLAVALLGLPMSPGLPLDFVGMPGCRLLVITIDAMPVPISGAAATLSLAIPSDPTLAGVELGAQFVTVDPTANALGMHASNGVRLRLDR